MRTQWMWALLVLLPLTAAVALSAQQATSVPVVDRTDQPAPFEISGTFTSEDKFAGNDLVSTCALSATAKNISGKPVVLLVASAETRSAQDGCSNQHTFQQELFFGTPLAPDAALALSNSAPHREESGPHNPLGPAGDPQADARVLFVQFADGTTFGDPEAAKDILEKRARIVDALLSLKRAYDSGGNDGFSQALKQKFSADIDFYFDRFRRTAEKAGTAAAVVEMEKAVGWAAKNGSLLVVSRKPN